jgi:hypothetical protein
MIELEFEKVFQAAGRVCKKAHKAGRIINAPGIEKPK